MDAQPTRPRLLLVDDEAMVRDVVRDVLDEAGYAVLAVSSGAEACEALDGKGGFVALVTDIDIGAPPAGWDVAVRARQIDAGIAVVYMTGDSAHEWSVRGVPQSTIVTKPFAPAQIAVAVAALLNRSDADRPS